MLFTADIMFSYTDIHVDNNNSEPNGEDGEYQRNGEEGQTVTKDFLVNMLAVHFFVTEL